MGVGEKISETQHTIPFRFWGNTAVFTETETYTLARTLFIAERDTSSMGMGDNLQRENRISMGYSTTNTGQIGQIPFGSGSELDCNETEISEIIVECFLLENYLIFS